MGRVQYLKDTLNEADKKPDGYIAIFQGKKVEIPISVGGIFQAKQEAIKLLKVPKSKIGLLAIKPAYNENLGEARLSGKDIPKMIKAIKDEDEKTLLKYMAMDKKNMFSQRHLMAMVNDKLITREEAKKLSTLSIGVAHALAAFDATLPANKEKRRERAMQRVKEVE